MSYSTSPRSTNQSNPIKRQGFDIPTSPSTSSQNLPSTSAYIDPSVLAFTYSNYTNGMNGGGGSATGWRTGTGGGGGLDDSDLDFSDLIMGGGGDSTTTTSYEHFLPQTHLPSTMLPSSNSNLHFSPPSQHNTPTSPSLYTPTSPHPYDAFNFSTFHHQSQRTPAYSSTTIGHSLSLPQYLSMGTRSPGPSTGTGTSNSTNESKTSTPGINIPMSPSSAGGQSELYPHTHARLSTSNSNSNIQTNSYFTSPPSLLPTTSSSSSIPTSSSLGTRRSTSTKRRTTTSSGIIVGSPERSRPHTGSGSGGSSGTIGKAPTPSSRSRSARRASTSNGTGTGSPGIYTTSGTGSSTASIVIPSNPHGNYHPLASSMPAFPTGGFGSINIRNEPTSATSSTATTSGGSLTNGWYLQSSTFSQPQPHNQTRGENVFSLATPAPAPGTAQGSSSSAGGKKGKSATGSSGTNVGLDDVMEDHDFDELAPEVVKSPSLAGMTTLQLTAEKRRKRRESHNLVERRRRDNINDRITELASLLPECLLEQARVGEDEEEDSAAGGVMSPSLGTMGLPNLSGEPSSITSGSTTTNTFLSLSLAQASNGSLPSSLAPQLSTSTSNSNTTAAATKPNKGIILSKSVEYIKYLQQLVGLYQTRNEELERVVSAGSGGGESEEGFLGSRMANGMGQQQQEEQSTPEEIQQRRLYFASLSHPSSHSTHEYESTITTGTGKSESMSPDDWTTRRGSASDEMGGMGLEGMEMEE